jgi:hypothetical protein
VTGATHYRLWVNDAVTQAKINTLYTAAQVGCGGGGTCAITPNVALVNGAAAFWVEASNGGVNPARWSAAGAFTVAVVIQPPLLLTPNASTGTRTPTFTWQSVPTAQWYLLWIDDSTGNVFQRWYSPAQLGCDSGATCSVGPGVNLVLGAARFWVLSWKPAGQSWSEPMNFTVTVSPPQVVTALSVAGTTTSTRQFRWQASAGATWYRLWVNDASSKRYDQWITAAQAGCSSGTGTCSFVPGVSLAGAQGQFWVQAWNVSGGPSAWSAGLLFVLP